MNVSSVVLATGAFGLLGSSFRKVACQEKGFDFVYVSRKDCNLLNRDEVDRLFSKHKPDVVVHLASCVGGVYDNMSRNFDFLLQNVHINLNVVEACNKYQVKQLVNVLSTCIFPDKRITYPLTSDQLHEGLPHHSNIGYAYSKRLLHVASELLIPSTKVVNLIPTNLYGEHDNFNIGSAHVIPALIHKTYLAKKNNTDLVVFGSGNAKRQFLYADDLSTIILKCLTCELPDAVSCIVSPKECDEKSIKDVVDLIVKSFNFTGNVIYDKSHSDGQEKKTTNDDELTTHFGDFAFTSLNEGLQKTVDYFTNNYDTVRK
jgi:GDP-L-fucose synthase